MSALDKLKGIILFNMKSGDPDVKRGITKVLNAIDSDLDLHGYETSSDTDAAFIELEEILIKLDKDEEDLEPLEDEEIVTLRSPKKVQSHLDDPE